MQHVSPIESLALEIARALDQDDKATLIYKLIANRMKILGTQRTVTREVQASITNDTYEKMLKREIASEIGIEFHKRMQEIVYRDTLPDPLGTKNLFTLYVMKVAR